APVPKNEKRKDFVEIVGFLKMQAAKFEIDNEHARFGLGTYNVMRKLQRVHSCVTAHEADDCPLGGAGQVAAVNEFDIKPGSREAGAAAYQEMSDVVTAGAELKSVHGALREPRCHGLENLHPCGRARKLSALIEVVGRIGPAALAAI